jgi:hypothetical protein
MRRLVRLTRGKLWAALNSRASPSNVKDPALELLLPVVLPLWHHDAGESRTPGHMRVCTASSRHSDVRVTTIDVFKFKGGVCLFVLCCAVRTAEPGHRQQ